MEASNRDATRNEFHAGLHDALEVESEPIVQLPQDAAEGLRSRVGESITFEGRLLNCDVLMRTFFIVDSKLP